MKHTASYMTIMYVMVTVVPVIGILMSIFSATIKNWLQLDVSSDYITLVWWVVYFFMSVAILSQLMTASNAYTSARLTESACDSIILENETMRYKLYNYFSTYSGYTYNIIIVACWSTMVATLTYMAKHGETTIGVIWKATVLLLTLIFMITTINVFESYPWFYTTDMTAYNESKKTVEDFLKLLQTATVSLPSQFQKIRTNIVRRIMTMQEQPSLDDAMSMFQTSSASKLFELLSLANGGDSDLIVEPLQCQNVLANITSTLIYKKRVIELLLARYSPYFTIKNINDVYRHIAERLYAIDVEKYIPPEYLDSDKKLKSDIGVNILKNIKFDILEDVFQYLPLRPNRQPDMTLVKKDVIKMLSSLTLTECSNELTTTSTLNTSVVQFFQKDPSCDTTSNTNTTDADAAKKAKNTCNEDTIKRIEKLRVAVSQLRNLTNLSIATHVKNRLTDIVYFAIFIVAMMMYKIFHEVYNITGASIMTLSVLIIIVGIIYINSFVVL